jgi:hypothetical protein
MKTDFCQTRSTTMIHRWAKLSLQTNSSFEFNTTVDATRARISRKRLAHDALARRTAFHRTSVAVVFVVIDVATRVSSMSISCLRRCKSVARQPHCNAMAQNLSNDMYSQPNYF